MQNMQNINAGNYNGFTQHMAGVENKSIKNFAIFRLLKPFPILMTTILMAIIIRFSSMIGYDWVDIARSSGHGGSEAKKVEAPKEPEAKIMNNPREKELLSKGEKIELKSKDKAIKSELHMGGKNSIGGEINVKGLKNALYRLDPLALKPEEVSLLYELARIKSKTEEEDKELSQKKITIKALNKTLSQKIAILENLKKEIQETLNKAQVVSEENIKGLVVMYEKMKPKDAARIFDGLNPQIVFLVMEKMNRGKSSMILAKMDSDKARLITQKLALERDVKRALKKNT